MNRSDQATRFSRSAPIYYILLGAVIALSADKAHSATFMFADTFLGGTMSPEWVSIAGTQWVDEGWFHTQSLHPSPYFPRNSAAVVHDGDTTWTDYDVSLRVDPILYYASPFEPWEFADVYLRTSDFHLGPNWPLVNAYVLHFNGPSVVEGPGVMTLSRQIGDAGTPLAYLESIVGTNPMDVRIELLGDRIRVAVDGVPMIDVTDPSPLLYGGVGVGAGWESHARFDDILVVRIPEPSSLTLLALGCLLTLRRQHR